jgi:hypothetical protein
LTCFISNRHICSRIIPILLSSYYKVKVKMTVNTNPEETVDDKPAETNVKTSNKDKMLLAGTVAGVVGFIVAGLGLTLWVSENPTVSSSQGKLFSLNASEGSAENLSATEDAAVGKAWWGGVEYVAGDSLSTSRTEGEVYRVVSKDVKDTVVKVAKALNVDGQLYSQTYDYGDGYSYTEIWWGFEKDGYVDYSKPNVSAYVGSGGSMSSWSYNSGWDDMFYGDVPMEEPASSEPFEGEAGAVEGSEGGVGGGGSGLIAPPDFEEPTPADKEAALASVETFLTTMGENPENYELFVDEQWGTSIIAEMMLNGEPTPLMYNFYFNSDGSFSSVSGYAATLESMGVHPVVSEREAAERANSWVWFGQPASSIYTKHYNSLDTMVSNRSDGADVMVSDMPVSTTSELMPKTSEPVETIEPYMGDVSYDEVVGLIIEYVEGVEPEIVDSIIKGFEVLENPTEYVLGKEIMDGVWTVSFPDVKTSEETETIIDMLLETGLFTTVSGDYIIYTQPSTPQEPTKVVLDEAKLVWVIVNDNEGNPYLTKGYVFTSSEDVYALVTIMGVPEELIEIPEDTMVGIMPKAEIMPEMEIAPAD